MADVADVHLLLLRRFRGAWPLTRHALQSDGSLLLALPDERETRTVHLLRLAPNGDQTILHTFHTETLRRIEIGAGGERHIGTTEGELYLYAEGHKSRFLPERRVFYDDVALSEDGSRFACVASAPVAGSTASLALTRDGRALWHKDLAFEATSIALCRDGALVAIGGQSGEVLLLDSERQTLFLHRQDAPVLALATLGPERTAFATEGSIACLDAEGGLIFLSALEGTPVALALARSGVLAALCALEGSGGRLTFFSPDGLPGCAVEYEDVYPSGLSLSADGAQVAVSLRDGSVALYALETGRRRSGGGAARAAQRLFDAGDFEAAARLLLASLANDPGDAESGALLAQAVGRATERRQAAALSAQALEDWREADAQLQAALALAPFDPSLAAARAELRARWAEAALQRGRAALASGESLAAEEAFLEALEADPLRVPAREGLADARHLSLQQAIDEGHALLERGNPAAARAMLSDALRRGAESDEALALLGRARLAEALQRGEALYAEGLWAAALFEFQKVLRLDPEHAEARQKSDYARRFLIEKGVRERFERLE